MPYGWWRIERAAESLPTHVESLRALVAFLNDALDPFDGEVPRALRHAVPVRYEGTLDVAVLAAAGIRAVPIVRRSPAPNALTARVRAAAESVEARLRVVAPERPSPFAAPAWLEDVEQLASTVGYALPDELVAWLGLHDGTLAGSISFGRWRLEPAARIEASWVLLREVAAELGGQSETSPDVGVRAEWWNDHWIPFAEDGAGNRLCIDHAPASGGRHGQVIEYVHDHGARPCVAPGLVEWLEGLAESIRDGRLVVIEQADGSFASLSERDVLSEPTGARLRGESPGDRKTRLDAILRERFRGVVREVLAYATSRIRYAPGSNASMLLWLEGVLDDQGTRADLAHFVSRAQRSTCVTRFDLTAAELDQGLDAWFAGTLDAWRTSLG